MEEPPTCSVWRPEECMGTPACPPRCPRFVDRQGRAVLVEPREPPFGDAAPGLEPVATEHVGADDLVLAAVVDGTVLGYAWLRPGDGGHRRARVDVAPEARDGDLPAELASQAVAYAVVEGAGRLVVDDVGPFVAAGLDPVATGNGYHAVPLTDPAATGLTTPPGRDDGGVEGSAGGTPPSPGAVPNLSGLFGPGRVAVVGATDREGAVGRLLLENLRDYAGEVVPVTPGADVVFGRSAPDSLREVGAVDLAIVAVPPEAAVEAVETAGECGIDNVVVVSAGFEEAGGDEYARRIRGVAKDHDLNLVGPNSMGVMSTATGLNATFSPRPPPRGAVSLISQSGAFVTAAMAAAGDRGLGFRHVVSVGNKAVIDEVDLLRYLDTDPGTAVIAAYLEDVVDGEAFVDVARTVTRSTPVVVLKSGRTTAGARAAASHTGSLGGDDDAVDAAFDRSGVLRADSSEQLLDYAATLRGPIPAEADVGIVTNAGGPGVLATDAAAAEDLPLAEFEADTLATLEDVLPAAAAVDNPVDVLGDADIDRFAAAVDAVIADPGVDVGVTVTTPHPVVDPGDLLAAVGRCTLARDTPVVTCLMDGELDTDARRALRRYGIPNYPDPSRAAAAVDALRQYTRYRDRPAVDPPSVDLDREHVREVIEQAREAGRTRLGVASLDLLSACGLDVPAWGLAESPAEAADVAAELGGEVVLKVASPDVAHKADVGGVRVGVDPGEAAAACEGLLADVRAAKPDARVDGVVVQAAVDVAAGVESHVGTYESRFGPLIAFGLGGTLVEHLEDVVFELVPLDRIRARTMLDSIDAAPVLDGARGRDAVDSEALVDDLVRLSALVETVPEIEALDVNPLVATPGGATAVDLQVELSVDG